MGMWRNPTDLSEPDNSNVKKVGKLEAFENKNQENVKEGGGS